MDFKTLKFQIPNESIARRVVLRALMIASALSIIPLLHTLSGSDPGLLDSLSYKESDVSYVLSRSYLLKNRVFKPIWNSFECKKSVNLTTTVVSELMSLHMLDYSATALCVGEGSPSAVNAMRELGFVNACGVHRNSFFSLNHRKSVYELEYGDDSFDFVLSGDLDKVSVPAMLVLEIDRVLKPGGIGAVLVGPSGLNRNSLIKSATPISSLLKTSSVVHVDYVLEFTLVVFKKRLESVSSYQHFSLPDDCQSITNNEPWMPFLEPIVQNWPVDSEKSIAYLPNFIDMPSKKRLVYVEIGAGERQKYNATSLLIPSYPGDHNAFNVYFVDHNASALLSSVKKPGVTFIYYPALAGEKASPHSVVDDSDPTIVEDDGFNFLEWFKETVQYADFVVLKMKAGEEELKFLTGLFQSGTICFVDELFLSCPDLKHGGGSPNGDCVDLLKSLRSSGVFVHQWWDLAAT